LEVAQIARDLARALGANEDLTEAIALGHDLGHPPFGHAGEHVLDELMRNHGGFEHNRQSLRVVDYLEHPYPGFRGLNLTEVVRESLARHETKYDSPAVSEFPPGLYAPVEGQVVDLADEIAWTSADLEDALGSGILTVERLAGLDLWERGWGIAEADYPHAKAIHKRIRTTKAVLGLMADDVLAATERAIAETGIATPDDVRRAGKRVVGFTSSFRKAVDELQQFLLNNVYLVGANAHHARQTERIIRELFEAYAANSSLLPERYAHRIGEEESLHRVACDYIAGMTDRFCREEHTRISGGAS
jgi:dGTPase